MDNSAVGMTSEGGGGGSNGMAATSSANNGANSNNGNVTSSGDDAQPQLFCLRWNNYQTNLTCSFDQLLQSELLVDVTLACADGQFMKAHRMVLSACSPYFQTLFSDNPCKHPIVILKDIGWSELKAVVEFMYKGEINVCQEQIEPLLKVAESLKIRGLADVSSGQDFARAAAASTAAAAAAAAAERNNRSPTSAQDASSSIRASPSRGIGCAVSGGPSRKRRRTSADRMNGGADDPAAAFSAALNSPSRALELISAPMSAASVNVSTTSSSAQSAHSQSQQQHQQPHANRPPSQTSAAAQSPPNMPSLPIPPPPHSAASNAMASSSVDDMEIKPGIAEMIREEERAKMFESSQAWLNASTSSLAYLQPSNYDSATSSLPSMQLTFGCSAVPTPTRCGASAAATSDLSLANFGAEFASPAKVAPNLDITAPTSSKLKSPSWNKAQLRQAIKAVITQQLRFTEASAAYNVPKGTLYDNILGKTRAKRMRGLDVAALSDEEEAVVLEFCCNVSASTYNRRTPRALHEVLHFVETLVRRRNSSFRFDEMNGFRWWWAFCKKHGVLVLNYTRLSGEKFVAAGYDRVRVTADRAAAIKRHQRNAQTTQLRLDAHAYVTPVADAQPFDFSKRNSAVVPAPATSAPTLALAPTSSPLAPTSLALAPTSLKTAPTSLGAASALAAVAPVSASVAPVCAGPALASFGVGPAPPALPMTSSAGGWNAQQFLSTFGPLSEFGGAPGPIQDLINSLMKEEVT